MYHTYVYVYKRFALVVLKMLTLPGEYSFFTVNSSDSSSFCSLLRWNEGQVCCHSGLDLAWNKYFIF